jgi:thiol:disulfide interchange protein DsbA
MKLRLLLLLALLLPLAAHAAAPVAGTDYVEIPGGQPFAPVRGKVEVAEVFGYSCIHCWHLEPTLAAWKKRQPAHVKFTPVPAAFGGYWTTFARAYFAAQKLGLLERTHTAVFTAVHETGSLPVQNVSNGEIASFYAGHGADPKAFAAAMTSPEVEAQLDRARRFTMASGVEGTPTLIVNGRYRITARSFDEAMRTVDYLVAREGAPRK